ncbi:MAG: hypothetical protein LUE14_13530 [Clostridiales bacterium]|nr:hypothetical protein [Clostridiales bacterium]
MCDKKALTGVHLHRRKMPPEAAQDSAERYPSCMGECRNTACRQPGGKLPAGRNYTIAGGE